MIRALIGVTVVSVVLAVHVGSVSAAASDGAVISGAGIGLTASIGQAPQGAPLLDVHISSSGGSITATLMVGGAKATVGVMNRQAAASAPPRSATVAPAAAPLTAPVAAAPAVPVQVPVVNELAAAASNPVAAAPPPALAPGPAVRPGAGTPSSPPPARRGGPKGEEPTFTSSVPDIRHVSTDPGVILVGVLATAAVLLLVPFPSELVNRTYAEHHDEILAWLRPLAGLLSLSKVEGAGLQTWLVFGGFSLVTGALFSLLDPGSGLSLRTLATLLGMAGAVFAFTMAWGLASTLYLSRRLPSVRYQVRILISALPLAALCVLVSRLTHFQPGYLYGLIAAFVVTRWLSRSDEGSSIAVSAGATAVLAVAAWLARLPIADLASQPAPPFAAVVANTFLTALFVLGLEHLVFRLLPLRFLEGATLRTWSTAAWTILFGIGLFGFLHVLIDPVHGYTQLADSKRAGLLTSIGLFAGFGLFSVLFWGYFRFRPQRVAGSRAA